MSVQTNQTRRAVNALTLGVLKGYVDKRESNYQDSLDEYDSQFQVGISATCKDKAVWSSVEVDFPVSYLSAVDAKTRDSAYGTPLFTYGVEGTGGAMFVTVQVTSWKTDPTTNGITGATVAIGIVNPGVKKASSYSGIAHLNFQGYAAPKFPTDEETDDASEGEN